MKPLNAIRILDLTHMLSGPYAGMMLADLGAETIKVEPPGKGEGTRRLLDNDPQNSLHGDGAYFLTLNRNKKSVTLDLKAEKGLALFYELVKTADILLYNFSAGVAARLKIDYDHLAPINPRLISCAITGFGETGPRKDQTAFDMVAQAMGGGMSITGQPGDPPTRSGIPIGDLGGGLMAVIGVLAALQARQFTGRGQHVDIAMLDAQISLLNYMATMYFLSGAIPDKLGNGHFVHVPYDTFQCADGYIIIAVITDQFWAALMTAVDAPDLNVEEYKQQPGRLKNKALINGRLNEILATNTQRYWLDKLKAARIPCAPVNNLAQALADEQVLWRDMVVEVAHPLGGSVKMPGNPIKLSETQADSFAPPPLLGQHNEEIYQQRLGLSAAELAALRAEGIV
jgi:crotonobetainyl-CoA:carnitine CoA-transferase CaiB-like acyl-CoA transferase